MTLLWIHPHCVFGKRDKIMHGYDSVWLEFAMHTNDEIMLAVFENFLKNPEPIYHGSQCGDTLDDILDEYVPYELTHFDSNLLRWHVILFASEFLLNVHIAKTRFGEYTCVGGSRPDKVGFKEPIDYLNWSGHQLYKRLKDEANKEKAEK